jgi:polysaccharide biosynthesis/export protein
VLSVWFEKFPMRLVFAFIACFCLSGCAQTWETVMPSAPPGGTGIKADHTLASGAEAVSSISELPNTNEFGVLPPFAAQGEAAAYEFASGYRVGAGDRLSIRVAGEQDLTGEYIVDPTGVLSLPYVNSVTVAGLNTGQIEQLIVSRLRAGYLRDPKVSVQATNLRPFYIMGQVTTGGSFPYQPGMSVQNAIAIAGGYSPRADQTLVMLTRKTANGTNTYKVPVTTQVYPGDIVYVVLGARHHENTACFSRPDWRPVSACDRPRARPGCPGPRGWPVVRFNNRRRLCCNPPPRCGKIL